MTTLDSMQSHHWSQCREPVIKDVFVWRWNIVEGKLWRENGNENFFGMCLVGWRRRKINNGTQVFSSLAHQKILSKMEWKLKREIWHHFWTKMPTYNCTFTHITFLHTFFFFFFLLMIYLAGVACLLFSFFLIYWVGLSSIFFFFFKMWFFF